MARLIYALNQSLDGIVDHDAFDPEPALFQHFIDDVATLTGCIYGRRMYETMRYWDAEQPEWGKAEREYAAAWRRMPKWVVSRTQETVGPNATLLRDDIEAGLRALKSRLAGDVEVAGPELAEALSGWGLLDEVRLYIHPVVVGSGKRMFRGAMPPLRLLATERIGSEVVRLRYEVIRQPG